MYSMRLIKLTIVLNKGKLKNMLLLDKDEPGSFRNVEAVRYTLAPPDGVKSADILAHTPNSQFLVMSQDKIYDRTDLIRSGLNDIYTPSRKKP